MFSDFFNKTSQLPPHYQPGCIYWNIGYLVGRICFDEFFLPKIKSQYRVLFAFLIGLVILVVTHQAVNNLM
jgi:hypothetical protein